MNKLLKAVSVGLILGSSTLANAGIIDNGSYTTVDGLDWLDFSATVNMTQTEALAANGGWRAATLFEALYMLDTMFARELIYTDMTSDYTIFADGHERATEFGLLFGAANTRGFAHATVETIGLIAVTRRFVIAGGHLRGLMDDYAAVGYSADTKGIALVRGQIEVSEPSTVVIFVLGLLGLASRRFNKKS